MNRNVGHRLIGEARYAGIVTTRSAREDVNRGPRRWTTAAANRQPFGPMFIRNVATKNRGATRIPATDMIANAS